MTNESAPNFARAVEDFQKFLAEQSVSSDLVWIFREDVVWCDRHIFIKEPLPKQNFGVAQTLFDRGWKRGLGVSLDVLCLVGSRHCGFVWLPENEREAELHLLAGLKMSVPTKLSVATAVRSSLKWRWLKWRHEESFWGLVPQPVPRRNI